MLLQTNSYIVPKEKRAEHARLMRRFRQILNNLGCDNFDVYEQVGANWSSNQSTGRFVQIMRFRDRKHQLAVQNAERNDPAAQQLIAEFCQLINYPVQTQQNLFAVGFYNSVLPVAPVHVRPEVSEAPAEAVADGNGAAEAFSPEVRPVHPQAISAFDVVSDESAAPANDQTSEQGEPDIELDIDADHGRDVRTTGGEADSAEEAVDEESRTERPPR